GVVGGQPLEQLRDQGGAGGVRRLARVEVLGLATVVRVERGRVLARARGGPKVRTIIFAASRACDDGTAEQRSTQPSSSDREAARTAEPGSHDALRSTKVAVDSRFAG